MALLRDQEFRTYAVIVAVATLLLTYVLLPFARDPGPEYMAADSSLQVLFDAPPMTVLRQAAFQVVTIITTAGFATDDFNLWNDQARVILLVLMFIGGSAGSAAGGPKIVRAILIFKYAAVELLRVLHPQAVTAVRYNGKVVPNRVLRAIVAFLLLYLLVFTMSVVALSVFGADLLTSITASIATLGNIGPGYSIVGPMGSYASLPVLSKIVLFLNMWIGRLEVITVLVFLQPAVWRMARLDD
jgi:trk system potassium uptake protein TrkH